MRHPRLKPIFRIWKKTIN